MKLARLETSLHTGLTLARAGVLRPERPDKLARVGLTLLRWGPTPASGYAISALRTPDRPAIHDDRGTITFAELQGQTNALAHSLRELGVREGDSIAIFCRDHRGFVEAIGRGLQARRHAAAAEHLVRWSPDRRGSARPRTRAC